MTLELFFDIDGTLIDTKYSYNYKKSDLVNLILDAKKKDINFNMNSNRSLKSILKIYDDLEFNGVIIYENGAGIFNPASKSDFQSNINPVDKLLVASQLKKLGYEVCFTDTDEALKNPLSYLKSSSRIAFCEDSRNYTSTIYPRKKDDFKLVSENLDEIVDLLTEVFCDYNIEKNLKYQNLILIPKRINKGTHLTSYVKRNMCLSFGDDVADIEMFKKSDYFGCPLNSSPEVKKYVIENGSYMSEKEYTAASFDFIKEAIKLSK